MRAGGARPITAKAGGCGTSEYARHFGGIILHASVPDTVKQPLASNNQYGSEAGRVGRPREREDRRGRNN